MSCAVATEGSGTRSSLTKSRSPKGCSAKTPKQSDRVAGVLMIPPMKAFALPPETAAQISALQTDLRLWVLTLVAWLARHVPSRWMRLLLQQSIRDARKDMRLLIFAKVLMRLRHRQVDHRHQVAQPAAISAPPGFRLRRRRTKTLKLVTRGIRLRTLKDMRHVIDNFDAVVTRAFKRLPRDLRGGVLVMTCAQKPARASFNITPATEAADTS